MDDVIDALLDANYTTSFAVDYSSAMTSKDFDSSADYAYSVAWVVACIYAAGIVALVLFWLGMLSRCCFTCCRCIPSQPSKGDATSWTDYRIVVESLFYISIVSALACNVYTLIGRSSLTEGVQHMQAAVGRFGGLVTDIGEDGDQLFGYGGNLTVLARSASQSCPYISLYSAQLNSSIRAYMSNVQDLQSTADSLDSMVGGAEGYFAYYAEGAALAALFGFAGLFVCLQAVFHAAESHSGMKAILSCNNLTFLAITTAGAACCALMLLAGDFCVTPSHHLVSLLPAGDARNVTTYYATCYGTSTVEVSLDEGRATIAEFNMYLDLVLGLPGCGNNPDLVAMQGVVGQINSTLFDLYNLTECRAVHGIYNEFVYDGLCGKAAEGAFYVWGSQILVAAMLFISMVLGALAYQMYRPPKESAETYYAAVPVAADLEVGEQIPLADAVTDDRIPATAATPPPPRSPFRWSLGGAQAAGRTHEEALLRALAEDSDASSSASSEDDPAAALALA